MDRSEDYRQRLTECDKDPTYEGKTADEDRKPHGIIWLSGFVAVASQIMICKGLFFSITGPTLQYLVVNTDSSVDKVSIAFSGSAIGITAGAVAYSYVKSKVKDMKPLLSSGIALLIIGLVNVSTPFIHSVAPLVLLHTLCGFMYGYSNSGLQSLYLTKCGEAGSRPFVQLHHFMYSFGAFIAPFIAKPFLEMASLNQNHSTACPSDHIGAPVSSEVLVNESRSSADFALSNPTSWSFVVIGAYTIVVSIFCYILAACKVEKRIIAEQNHGKIESRQEGLLKDLWMFFGAVIMYKFCCVGSEMVYQSYIYSVAVCSDLKMNVSEASLLNSLFWGGFVSGRLFGIVLAKYFKPSTIIVTDFVGLTLTMTTMSIWGEHSKELAWIATAMFGLSISTLFPSGISFAAKVTNVTGKYIFIFAAGGTLGASLMQPIAGLIFRMNPFAVIYVVAGICVANIVFFLLMKITAWHALRTDEKISPYHDCD